jgi:hypothetical protein
VAISSRGQDVHHLGRGLGAEYSAFRDAALYFRTSAGQRSEAPGPTSSGNLASNSASEIPNAPAVALFGASNAIIARTKRRSASREFEAPSLSAASAPLSASRRRVIAFRFGPDPGLAPPRPIPLDFVILKTFDRVRAWLLNISQRQLWCAARMRLVDASG